MNLSQRGKANDRVKVKCLEDVKIYGNNPIKLLNKIKENNEIKINEDPNFPCGNSKVLNWSCKININLNQNIWVREGINQKDKGIINNPRNVLIQFNDKLKIEEEGSNEENKLVIIFKLEYLLK